MRLVINRITVVQQDRVEALHDKLTLIIIIIIRLHQMHGMLTILIFLPMFAVFVCQSVCHAA